MPAGTKAHQLAEVCQVGAALIILSFKPCQIDQQLSWSWLTCIGGNRHVSPPLTVLTLSAAHRNCLASLARGTLSVAEPDLKWPLPIRGVGPVDAELIGVLCTRDLLIEQCLS